MPTHNQQMPCDGVSLTWFRYQISTIFCVFVFLVQDVMAAMRCLWVSYDMLCYFIFEKLLKNKLCNNIHASFMSHFAI